MEFRSLKLQPWQVAAIHNPYTFFVFFGGIASLKTVAGAYFVIKQILERPHLTGLVGANSYDQLSAATLKELFRQLEICGLEFVIDRMPLEHWNVKRALKSYSNVLTVYNPHTLQSTTIFTRVMSDPDSLRGLTLSWIYLDETRDTREYAFDIMLSRLRESDYMKVFMTTSPNGHDWVYKRFCENKSPLYGSMHIETHSSVKAGIISQAFYDSLLSSYSPLLAEQELFAKHVNVMGGRAYYAFGEHNKKQISPWGDEHPNPQFPLVVGVDFNFAPAPLLWMLAQTGYIQINGQWTECIHWFAQLRDGPNYSTEQMTERLVREFPGFFYRVFGDASGTRGTTSNQGETDYLQMQEVFNRHGCAYSIDVDKANPRVKDRIETMNALAKNGLGQVRMTYNPDTCPDFDADVRSVGWKAGVTSGKLDDGGDYQRTHASDGAGYAVMKLFDLGVPLAMVGNVPRRFADLTS